jgi:hypothetical protein
LPGPFNDKAGIDGMMLDDVRPRLERRVTLKSLSDVRAAKTFVDEIG